MLTNISQKEVRIYILYTPSHNETHPQNWEKIFCSANEKIAKKILAPFQLLMQCAAYSPPPKPSQWPPPILVLFRQSGGRRSYWLCRSIVFERDCLNTLCNYQVSYHIVAILLPYNSGSLVKLHSYFEYCFEKQISRKCFVK